MNHFAFMGPEADIEQFLTQFGQRIRFLRKSQKMTQLDLSIASGVDLRQIQRIEYGEINTSIGNIYLLAKGLELSAQDLFKAEEPQ